MEAVGSFAHSWALVIIAIIGVAKEMPHAIKIAKDVWQWVKRKLAIPDVYCRLDKHDKEIDSLKAYNNEEVS